MLCLEYKSFPVISLEEGAAPIDFTGSSRLKFKANKTRLVLLWSVYSSIEQQAMVSKKNSEVKYSGTLVYECLSLWTNWFTNNSFNIKHFRWWVMLWVMNTQVGNYSWYQAGWEYQQESISFCSEYIPAWIHYVISWIFYGENSFSLQAFWVTNKLQE